MKRIVFAAVLLVFVSGCVTPSAKSMNIQRSGIRCVGDTATTVSLDSLATVAEVDAVKPKIKEIAMAVQLFLKDGKVADLTIPEITQELRKLIPEQYRFLLDILIAQIQGITVDVQKIGANNVERINSVCVGVLHGCDLYDVKYRPVTAFASDKQMVKAVNTSGIPEQKFGVRLKKEMGVR
jgi:hypothetical protein